MPKHQSSRYQFVIRLIISSLVFISCGQIPSLKKNTPTSEIPERRNFPINIKINPCDDFYEHVCSKVISGFKLRDDRSSHIFAFNDSAERLLEAKKEFLDGLLSRQDLSPRGKDLQTIFKACMNKDASTQEELKIVQNKKQEIMKFSDKKKFLEYVGKKLSTPDYSFLAFGTVSNLDHPDWYDIYFLGTPMSLPEKSYYDNKQLVEDLTNIIQDFFIILKLDNAKQRARNVVEFETQFSKTFPTPGEFRELFNKPSKITKKQALKKYPNFYLKFLFDQVPDKTLIRHISPENFKALNQSLANAQLETLKDVYLYHELTDYMDDAYPDFFAKKFDFSHRYLGGPPVRPERKERCTKLVMHEFNKELDAEMIEKLFPNFPEEKFMKVVRKIRSSIVSGIDHNTWLSKSGKKGATNKILTAKLQLVKPQNDKEWDFNPEGIYSASTPYANSDELQKNLIKKKLNELKTQRDRSRWAMGPLTVNAYYSPSDNKFVMPVGILQYPFFDGQQSEHANLGSVGAVIGHELGHGIDDKGAKYDSKGQMKQWMSNKDLAEFKKRGQNFTKQFDKIGHNGQLTLGENIGDHVGLTFAYNAAFANSPGNIESKKQFFYSYARVWCGVLREKTKELRLKTDPHALPKERVNQQVIHQPGFYEAFQCTRKDSMYLPPEKRIRIW